MKPILVLLFLLAYSIVASAQTDTKGLPSTTKIYNEEGKVQMTIFYNPSCQCKTYSEFFGDGKLLAKRVFKLVDGKEVVDGEDITYFHDGSIQAYKKWKDALPDGRFYFNHEDGRLEHEEFYDGKYKTGTWKYYDAFGRLVREQIYEPRTTLWNSKKDNATVKYYQNGTVVKTEKVKGTTLSGSNATTPSPAVITTVDGASLFRLKCKACHDPESPSYGPAVKSFHKKRKEAWLYQWVRNADELVAAGDKDALALYQQWNNKKHPSQTKLTDEQIKAILSYLKTQ